MLVRRLFNEQLAQASYLVVCQHARVALVVDPNRDIDRYIDAAAAEGARYSRYTPQSGAVRRRTAGRHRAALRPFVKAISESLSYRLR